MYTSELGRQRLVTRAASTPGAVAACGAGVLGFVLVAVAAAERGTTPSPGGPVFLAALGGAFALYALASWMLESRRTRLLTVLALGAAVQLSPLAGPLLLSGDVHSYAAYGRIDEALGGNPYVDPPASFVSDPVVAATAGGWRQTTSVYGPVFAAVTRVATAVTGADPAAAARFYRLLAAVSMLALMGLAAMISSRPDRAAAFVGWNPLLAVHFAGGGHNDATMMVLVLAGIGLTRRGCPNAGAVFWEAATAIKWIPSPLFALSALAAWRRRERSGLAAFCAAALVLALAATWRYGPDWARFGSPLAHAAEAGTHYSLCRLLGRVGIPSAPAAILLGSACVVITGLLFRSALAGRAKLGLAACALVAMSPWLLPWYAVWPVSIAATENERGARLGALALTAYLLSAHVSVS